MVAVVLGSGIVFLDTSVVNLALPRIVKDLPLGGLAALEAQSYVRDGYFLTLSALLILAGGLADYFGRRKLFAIGLAGFLVTSLMCALAPNAPSLIAFRLLQGAAGAVVVPGSLAIITASFQGEQQGRAFGLWAGASAATAILGPAVGGLLVDTVSWRAAFFVNVPFLLVALWAVRLVPESRDDEATARFDWLGSLVVILAVGGLAFGLIRGQQTVWTDVFAFVALGVGAVATVAFPILMLRRRNPLVPPKLFKSRNFTVTNLSTFVIYGALYISLSFQALFLIGTLGYEPVTAAIATIPGALFLALFSARFGRLAARYGPRLFMAAGPFVMALGLLYLVRFPADATPWVLGTGPGRSILPPTSYFVDLLPSLLIFGVGLMIMVAPLTTALMTSVPARNSGVASAINNAISRVGAPLAGALIFVAVASSFYSTITERVPGVDATSPAFREQVSPLNVELLRAEGASPELIGAAQDASTSAFHLSALVGAALLLIGAAVNGVGIRNRQAVVGAEGEGVAEPEPTPGAPARVDTIPEGVPCLPVASPTAMPADPRMHRDDDAP
jgi:EmrB/QacA subfamily drug resistance transporter